jgi:hypothetical protein
LVLETIALAAGTGGLVFLPVFARVNWSLNRPVTKWTLEHKELLAVKMVVITLLLHFTGIYEIGNDAPIAAPIAPIASSNP